MNKNFTKDYEFDKINQKASKVISSVIQKGQKQRELSSRVIANTVKSAGEKTNVGNMSGMHFTDINTPTYKKTQNILIDNAKKTINSSANNSNLPTASNNQTQIKNDNQNSSVKGNGNKAEFLFTKDTQNSSAKASIMYQPQPKEIINKGFSIEGQTLTKDDNTHSNNKMSNTMQENINNSDVYSVKEENANTNNDRIETYKKYEKDNVIVYNAINELYKTLDVINKISKDEIDPNIDVEKMKEDVERLIERMKKIGDEKVVKDIPVIGYRLNNVEKVLYADDPIKAMGIMTEGALSRYDTMRRYGDGYETNNNSDAYRHAIWNATSSAHYGNEFTQDWMNAHEYGFSDNFNEDSLLGTYMDLYNNSIGRYQGDKSNPREKRIGITKRINDRVQSGGLYRIENGELVTTNKVEEDKER